MNRCYRSVLRGLGAGVFLVFMHISPVFGQSSVKADVEAPLGFEPSVGIALKGGVSAFLNSTSYRPDHFLKPTTRVEMVYSLSSHRALGVEVVGTQSANEHYRLMGAYLFARKDIHRGDSFDMNFRWGFGLGTGRRILFKDLSHETPLMPWVQFGLGLNWTLLPGMKLGTGLVYENLSVCSVLISTGFEL